MLYNIFILNIKYKKRKTKVNTCLYFNYYIIYIFYAKND